MAEYLTLDYHDAATDPDRLPDGGPDGLTVARMRLTAMGGGTAMEAAVRDGDGMPALHALLLPLILAMRPAPSDARPRTAPMASLTLSTPWPPAGVGEHTMAVAWMDDTGLHARWEGPDDPAALAGGRLILTEFARMAAEAGQAGLDMLDPDEIGLFRQCERLI
ncbi:hypothetical protein [Bifidobacterium myosotis]|uniref:Uncharacterized protein n=1 Tax=Bifidobacterium myosotis TaxID=1630166 RepID=A0A5M9ZKG4_9BIFI|nr:hypothetical protein [Bifidobacterium myosotis]KAA8828117.1 hypothetical protein EMO91_06665 [Bifidobacterium myosotis]